MFNLFNRKEKNSQSELDLQFVQGVIDLLKKDPEGFSATWFGGTIRSSIKHLKKDVLIMRETGEIILPIEPFMTADQKSEIKKLIKPIVKKEEERLKNIFLKNKKQLVKNFFNNEK